MNYFRIMVMLSFILFAVRVWAETPGTMAQEAQQAYESGDYTHAIQKWEEIRSLGYLSGPIFYNLGNAAWQMGQGGRSRWYYLMGLSLEPRNDSLRHNLSFIDAKLGLEKRDLPEGPWGFLLALPWWKFSLSFFELLPIAAIFSLSYFGILFLKKWRGRRGHRVFKWGLGIPLLIVTGLLFLQARRLYFNRDAVVLDPGVALLSAPSSEAISGQSLPEGSIVRVQKKQGDFRLVKIPQSNPAWVEANKLGNLSL
jgi:hypothetical protein